MIGAITLLILGGPLTGNVFAQALATVPAADTGDTVFMLFSAALVLLMTPGLAFFYAGFVRSGNVLNTLMMSFVLMAIVGVTWIVWGYSLAFAPGSPLVGGLQWLGLNGVGLETTNYLAGSNPVEVVSYAATIPHQAFMIFQAMPAIITPALISGAIAERMSFRAYCLFVLLWSTFIYAPLAHMVWAKGGLLGLYGGWNALDFGGGIVVHISAGISALVAAIVLGPRKSYPDRLSPQHNIPFILLGAGLLWFGWLGFNTGGALSVSSGTSGNLVTNVATSTFVATNTAAAAATLMWLILEAVLQEKPTAVGAATGAVAGLVGITPAAGFVSPMAAILIGFITAFVCFYAINLKNKLKIDDSLDVFPVHGVGGTLGMILTGIFATTEINSLGKDGVLRGNVGQLMSQLVAIAIAYALSAGGTWIILKIIAATVGLRVKKEAELQGLDINEHGEEGYNFEFGDRLTRHENTEADTSRHMKIMDATVGQRANEKAKFQSLDITKHGDKGYNSEFGDHPNRHENSEPGISRHPTAEKLGHKSRGSISSKVWVLVVVAVLALGGGYRYFGLSSKQSQDIPVSTSGLPTYSLRVPKIYQLMADVSNVPTGTFRYGGSTTFALLRNTTVVAAITRDHPVFRLRYTEPPTENPGSGKGIEMLLEGQLSFSQSSRPVKDEEFEKAEKRGFKLKQEPVAIDGIALYVNPQLITQGLKGLTLKQVQNIFTGKITNWKEVGGSDVAITPFSRSPQASGTVDFFDEKVLEKQPLGSNVQIVRDTTESIRKVAKTPGGIGFATASEVINQKTIRTLALTKKANSPFVSPCANDTCTTINKTAFTDNSYPITRRLFVVRKLDGGLDEQAGIAYANMLLSDEGQTLVEQSGFVPLR